MTTMMPQLHEHISKKAEEAASFVTTHMPCNLSVDDIYEGLIGEPEVIIAFANAVQYLPNNALVKKVNVVFDGMPVSLMLRLTPTDRYPVFLLPKSLPSINSGSKLGQALAMPVRVARDWKMLEIVWKRMVFSDLDPNVLGLLFPWLRELLHGFTIRELSPPPTRKVDRDKILQQVKIIMRGAMPNRFPRLTPQLNAVCLSGRELFAQYRMLEASYHKDDLSRAAFSVERTDDLAPAWLKGHLGEVLDNWNEEQRDRTIEAIEKQLERRK